MFGTRFGGGGPGSGGLVTALAACPEARLAAGGGGGGSIWGFAGTEDTLAGGAALPIRMSRSPSLLPLVSESFSRPLVY